MEITMITEKHGRNCNWTAHEEQSKVTVKANDCKLQEHCSEALVEGRTGRVSAERRKFKLTHAQGELIESGREQKSDGTESESSEC